LFEAAGAGGTGVGAASDFLVVEVEGFLLGEQSMRQLIRPLSFRFFDASSKFVFFVI